MEPGHIAIRAVFTYLFLLALLRFSGKRTVAQGTSFDFVFALILGDMIDDLLWAEVPVMKFVVAMLALVTAHVALEMASSRSKLFATVAGGSALMFLRAGTLLKPALRNELLSKKEAEEMLRLDGIERDRWHELKSGWIELSGKPSVIKQPWARAAQKKDVDKLKKDL